MREFQKRAHSPPFWERRDIAIVSGGQDGLSKALEAILATDDALLVQDPFYPGAEVVVSGKKVFSIEKKFSKLHPTNKGSNKFFNAEFQLKLKDFVYNFFNPWYPKFPLQLQNCSKKRNYQVTQIIPKFQDIAPPSGSNPRRW